MGEVLIAGLAPELAGQVRGLLNGSGGLEVLDVENVDDARLQADRLRPLVMVLGPGIESDQALALAESAAAEGSDAGVVIVARRLSTALLRQAMKAGVRDVLEASQKPEELASAIRRAAEVVERTRGSAQQEATAPSAPKRGKIVTVFGTKGGVGKTTIATNLGVLLADRHGARTILLDLDLEFGDTAIMLQLAPTRTIFDAVRSFERLDAEMLEGFLARHPCGMEVLMAPVQPEQAEGISSSRITHIIDLASQLADYVVIDTPACFSEGVLCALDRSDEVYSVATMDVPSVKNTRISLKKLLQLGCDGGRIRLVLNRADSKVGLTPREVEKAVGFNVATRVPSDRLVPRAVNRGIPVVLDAPRSGVARSLEELARMVVNGNGNGKEVADHVTR
jgi:pilus assembly protein CpaE